MTHYKANESVQLRVAFENRKKKSAAFVVQVLESFAHSSWKENNVIALTWRG